MRTRNRIPSSTPEKKFSTPVDSFGFFARWRSPTLLAHSRSPKYLRVAGLSRLLPMIAGSLLLAIGTAFGSGPTTVFAWGNDGAGQTDVPLDLTNAVAIAASYNSLALTFDGTAVAWGGNSAGQTNLPPDLTNAVAIATGVYHSLALKSDGMVVGWGYNGYGQTNVPSGLTNTVAIAAGQYHSVALASNGTVTAWGRNDSGETDVPSDLTNAVAIAAGYGHNLALKSDGTVVGWGYNHYGETNVPSDLSNVVAIAAGAHHSLALKADATVVAWGANFSGQRNIPSGLTNVAGIAAGYEHSLALESNSTVVAWGGNAYGQADVPPGLTNVVAIAAGYNFSLALANNNGLPLPPLITTQPPNLARGAGSTAVFKVGANGTPPLGFQWTKDGVGLTNGGNVFGADSPTLTLSNVRKADAGTYTVLVTNAAGSAVSRNAVLTVADPVITAQPASRTNHAGTTASFTVGANGTPPLSYQWVKDATNVLSDGGRIGGTTTATLTFTGVISNDAGRYTVVITNGAGCATSSVAVLTVITAPVITWQPLSRTMTAGTTGILSLFAVSADGPPVLNYQWRRNGTNLVDDGNFSGTAAATLALALATPDDAGVYGVVVSNNYGAVASSNVTLSIVPPSVVVAWGDNSYGQCSVPAGLTNVVAMAAGYRHNLALKSDGTVVAWGAPWCGATNVPPDLTNAVAIAAGSCYSLALKGDGTVVGWGDYCLPCIQPPLPPLVAIAAGGSHRLGLKRDSTVIAWGNNSDGQCIVPLNLSNVVAIAAGERHSLALKANGTVVAWGEYQSGQTAVPSGLSDVVAITASPFGSLALRTDGVVVGWGCCEYAFPTFSNCVAMAAGIQHSLALRTNGVVFARGANSYGQATVPPGLTNVMGIAAGEYYSLALATRLPPVIAAQPASRTNIMGTTATFLVNAAGTEPLAYQWIKNGTEDLNDGGNVSGATLNALTLTNVGRRDAGVYRVLVTNVYGSLLSSNATLVTQVPQRLSAPTLFPDGTLDLISADADGGLLSVDDLPKFDVYASTNLVNWDRLTNGLILTNGQLRLHDADSTHLPQRFYQVIEH